LNSSVVILPEEMEKEKREVFQAPRRRGPARLLVFLVLLIGGLYAVHYLINSGMKRIPSSDFGAVNRVMHGRVNADVVINGSSRALVHYDPRELGAGTGSSVFNLGRNGSHTDLQAVALKTYLEHNSKPQLVIQNLDLHTLLPTEELYDVTTFVPYLSDEVIYSGFRSINPNVWKWRYLPLYAYVVEDIRFTWAYGLLGLAGVYPKEDYVDGFNPRYREWGSDFDRFKASHPNGVVVRTEAAGEAALKEIIDLCSSKNIRLLFVYSPEYIESQQLTKNRDAVLAKMKTIADTARVEMWDFSGLALCQQRDYFYNSQHLNSRGAKAFSAILAAKIAEASLLKPQPPRSELSARPVVSH
jgi:hypothetical protein